MSELEELRKKKLEELAAKQNQQQQLNQQIDAAESVVKQHLSKEALLRYGNIKVAYPELAQKIIIAIASAVQNQGIHSKITDEQFKELLKQLNPKKDVNIIRK